METLANQAKASELTREGGIALNLVRDLKELYERMVLINRLYEKNEEILFGQNKSTPESGAKSDDLSEEYFLETGMFKASGYMLTSINHQCDRLESRIRDLNQKML